MSAQMAPVIVERTKTGHVLDVIGRNTAAVAADAITINQIPAPTFEEGERADFLEERFTSLGLEVERTSKHDVLARLGGDQPGPTLLVQAGLDTVFPATVNPTARVDGKKVMGPGIGDNALGLASLLSLAEVLRLSAMGKLGPVLFAATAGTNRTGNVGGVRRVLKHAGTELGWALCVNGHGLGRISHRAVRTRRYHIRWRIEDGAQDPHEFLPDLLEALGALGHSVSGASLDLEPLEDVLTTGRTATDGIGLDLKLSPEAPIGSTDRRIRELVKRVADDRALPLQVVRVGEWDRASIEPEHELVRTVRAVHESLRIRSFTPPSGSEGAVLLAAGVPCVSVGISHGRNRHRESEWVELEPISTGLKQLFLIALSLSELEA